MSKIFWRPTGPVWPLLCSFSWQELRQHPWRNAAAVVSVMLGVALAFSVHLINASALDPAFVEQAAALPLVGDMATAPEGSVAIYVSEAMADLYGAGSRF